MNTASTYRYSFLIILIFVLLINVFPFTQTGFFPPSPDTAGLACGVKKINQTGSFFKGDNFYTGFQTPSCWSGGIYSTNQIFTYGIAKFTGLPIHYAAVIIAVLLAALIAQIMHRVSFNLFNNSFLALATAFFTATCIALSRSLLLTPHNLFGYLLIAIILWALEKYVRLKEKTGLLLILLSLAALVFFHQLSLFVILAALFIYFMIFYRSWKQRAVIIIGSLVLLLAATFYIAKTWNIFGFALNYLYRTSTEGYLDIFTAHPIWEHPAALGYVLSVLGLLGLLLPKAVAFNRLKPAYLGIFIVAVVFANTHLIGINLLPSRFIAYAWIPLALYAPLGMYWILITLKNSKFKLFAYVFLPLVFLASSMHAINYQQDDLKGFGDLYLPNKDIVSAMDWLNDHSSDKTTILTTARKNNYKSAYFAYLFKGSVISYPLFAFDHLEDFDIKDQSINYYASEKLPEPHGIGKLIKPFVKIDNSAILKGNQRQRDDLYEIYQMITRPDTTEAANLYNKYNVEYFIAWIGSQENEIFSGKGRNLFIKSYLNDSLIIYHKAN